jgi:DNA-binding response OmpR family regulator
MNDYFTKPMKPQELLKNIDQLVDIHKGNSSLEREPRQHSGLPGRHHEPTYQPGQAH